MMRAVIAILSALTLPGCFLDGNGTSLPDGAAPIDAFVPPLVDGGGMDGFVPPMDAGPRPDAGRDAGVEVVDAFVPPDTGPPDAGTDAGPPDSGLRGCADEYGALVLCDERGSDCVLYHDGMDCEDVCGSRCTAAYEVGAECGTLGAQRSDCDDNGDDHICICDRSPI